METPEQVFEKLVDCVAKLGWVIAMPKMQNENDKIPGLIIGEESYVEQVLNGEHVDESH